MTSAFTGATVHYTAGVSGLSTGLRMTVSPASFTLAPGQSRKLTISADSTGVVDDHWASGQVDITTSDTGDGGAAVPHMHMPVMVRAITPAPHMSIDQTELDFTVGPSGSAALSFTISNDGQEPLDWNLVAGKDCGGGGIRGLSLSDSKGTVIPHRFETVIATFTGNGLQPGTFNGVICVTGNASDNPKLRVSVQAKVTSASGSSGGGGGSLGFLGLAALAAALRRRMRQG